MRHVIKLLSATALLGASIAASPAQATAITVGFSFSGGADAPGSVTGQLLFDNAGTGVAATGAYVFTSSNPGIRLDPTFNFVGATRVLTNSFTVSAGGVISAADFSAEHDFPGAIVFLYLDAISQNRLNLYEEDRPNDFSTIFNTDGLAGVTFTPMPPATSDVPEAAAWAMMLGGFGLVGAALRRRPRARVAFA